MSDNWQHSKENDPLHCGNWQLAVLVRMNNTKTTDIFNEIFALYFWHLQYSSQWTSPNPLHWQLTPGHWQLTSSNNEHRQIKTLKSGPKIKKCCSLHLGVWQLATFKGKWPFALWQLTTGCFSQNEQHQNNRYIQWNFSTLLLASGNWQYSSQWTSPNPLHWQLTSGKNEQHQIKTLKSGPKIEKTCFSKKPKTIF